MPSFLEPIFRWHTVGAGPINSRSCCKLRNDQRLTHLLTRQRRRLFATGRPVHRRRTSRGHGSLHHRIKISPSTTVFAFFTVLDNVVLEICTRFLAFPTWFRRQYELRIAKSCVFLLPPRLFYAPLVESIRLGGGRNRFGCKRPSPVRYRFRPVARFVGRATTRTRHVSLSEIDGTASCLRT